MVFEIQIKNAERIMKMRNKFYITILFAHLIGLLGCNSNFQFIQEEQVNSPISVKGFNLMPFFVYDVSFNLIPGVIIGGHYDGISKIKQQNYFAPSSLDKYWKEEHLTIFIEECKNAGYKVLSDSDIKSSTINSENIIVIGSIENIEIKTYGEIAGDLTEVSITVLWEFYSSLDGKLIYKSTVSGKSRLNGLAVDLVSLIAFRNSVKNLLADLYLVDTLVNFSKNNSVINQYSYLH